MPWTGLAIREWAGSETGGWKPRPGTPERAHGPWPLHSSRWDLARPVQAVETHSEGPENPDYIMCK